MKTKPDSFSVRHRPYIFVAYRTPSGQLHLSVGVEPSGGHTIVLNEEEREAFKKFMVEE